MTLGKTLTISQVVACGSFLTRKGSEGAAVTLKWKLTAGSVCHTCVLTRTPEVLIQQGPGILPAGDSVGVKMGGTTRLEEICSER